MEAELDGLDSEEVVNLCDGEPDLERIGVLSRMAEPRDAVNVDPVAGHDGAGTGARGTLHRPAGGKPEPRRMRID